MISPLCTGTILATLLILLSACDDVSRFKQEKYECGLNSTGILEIDLRSMKVDAKVNILLVDRHITGKLVFSDDQNLVIKAPELIIRIDREKSLVKGTHRTNYDEMKCKKTEFKM